MFLKVFSMKRLLVSLMLSAGLISAASTVQAQAYADEWWDYTILNNQGDFNLSRGGVNFKCQRGGGDLIVTVAAGGVPNQTTIEFRNGGNYYRSTARKNAQGTYSFTVPGNRNTAMYRILTQFPAVNISVEAAGPIYVETGSLAGSDVAVTMQEFCSGGGSGNSGKMASASKGGDDMSCKLERKAKSKKGFGSLSLKIVNETSSLRAIYWFDTNGKRRAVAQLLPGQSVTRSTRTGQIWMATNSKGRCRQMLVARSDGSFVVTR